MRENNVVNFVVKNENKTDSEKMREVLQILNSLENDEARKLMIRAWHSSCDVILVKGLEL